MHSNPGRLSLSETTVHAKTDGRQLLVGLKLAPEDRRVHRGGKGVGGGSGVSWGRQNKIPDICSLHTQTCAHVSALINKLIQFPA